ncbi:MAG: stage V sporulation protein AD [Ruminococcaceae bacterium]|nr:stage V sporulation protein AD [Oscillospiraceae bacterium]
MVKRQGSTLFFQQKPKIRAYASAAGRKEMEGPLGGCFDLTSEDNTFGEKTFEKAESRLQKTVLELALQKAGLEASRVDALFAGDLQNQCAGSAYGVRDFGIPFLGLYGACSTMAEGLICGSIFVESGAAAECAAVTSSHFCAAERQFRFPLEYGGQRTPTSQWTATAAGCVLLSESAGNVSVTAATPGRIVDLGVCDLNNMGAAMAPAAADTLLRFFADTHTAPADFDLIATGDLGLVGSELLASLCQKEGVELAPFHRDCGLALYDREAQQVDAGGSGCGCGASVLCAEILPSMEEGRRKNILFVATGALMSTTTVQQGESIPSIAHLVWLSI